MDDFDALNEAIIKLNISNRQALRNPGFVLADGRTWEHRAAYWASEASALADEMGTYLVELPQYPGRWTAELFLRLAGEETE